MKAVIMAVIVVAALGNAGFAAAAGEDDAKKAGCLNCHAVDTKKIGPAFKDVAAKFKGKSDTDVIAALHAAKPHASLKASDEDLKQVASWILTLK